MRRLFLKTAVGAALLAAACGGTDEPVEPPTPFPGASPFTYPEELLEIEAEGETVLMVHVTTAGVVDSAYVLEAAPWSAFDSAALAPLIKAPLLCLAAGRDEVIPIVHSKRLFDAWAGPKRWVELPGALHNSTDSAPEFWSAIRRFLDEEQ